jgi:chromosome segregation ATPase
VPEASERLATLEQQIRDIRDDVASLTAETLRTRGRLHDLEGMIGQWVSIQKEIGSTGGSATIFS